MDRLVDHILLVECSNTQAEDICSQPSVSHHRAPSQVASRHVGTQHNPPRISSTHTLVERVVKAQDQWPLSLPALIKNPPEVKTSCMVIAIGPTQPTLRSKFSSFHQLNKIVTWIFRFATKPKKVSGLHESEDVLSFEETARAKILLLRRSQCHAVEDAIKAIAKDKPLPKNHSMSCLQLAIDKDGLLCVRFPVRLALNKSYIHPSHQKSLNCSCPHYTRHTNIPVILA